MSVIKPLKTLKSEELPKTQKSKYLGNITLIIQFASYIHNYALIIQHSLYIQGYNLAKCSFLVEVTFNVDNVDSS